MKDMERTRLDAIRRRLSYGAGTVLAVSFCMEHLEFDQIGRASCRERVYWLV